MVSISARRWSRRFAKPGPVCEDLCRVLPASQGEEPYCPKDWHHEDVEFEHPCRLVILRSLHTPIPDVWRRILNTNTLHAGSLRKSIEGDQIRFELRAPIPASHKPCARWTMNVELPTVDDVYLQDWNGQYIQKELEPGQHVTAFHVTKLRHLVEGNTLAGPRARGILWETATREGITYQGGLRAGASGHNGHYGVFVLNYFPGPYWCREDDCICEVQVTTATTVKSGSALRSCADEAQGNQSTKTCLTAIVLPLCAVPSALRFH